MASTTSKNVSIIQERLNRFEFQCQLPIKETQLPVKPIPNPNQPISPKQTKQVEKPESSQLQPIQFMGMNYMSRQIMYQANQSLCLFSIPKSKVTTSRTFSDILNEPQGKSELYTIENIQPLILKNCWVTVKNKKQLLFFNSHLDKGTDPAADSNGIYDLKVNQKSEEIFTLTKDYKQVRIWVYDIQDRQPKKFNSDRHMKKFQSFEVALSNRKNIYFNMGLLQFNIISEMDVLICQSSMVNEVSVWNTTEGVLVYNFSMDDYQKIAQGHEEFSGSSFTKDFANKTGASTHKNQGIINQNIQDRKFNFNAVATFQEFVIVYSNNQKKLLIWDIIKQETLMVKHLKQVKGPVVQLFVECAVDIFTGGILLMNEDGMIYEFSIAQGRIYSNAYNSVDRTQVLMAIEEDSTQSPMINHVMKQFFVHQQHKKLKELEQLYPHSFQDNDYQIMQNAAKLHFLMIENGSRQLYIMRDSSIDIVEMFQPAYPIYDYRPSNDEKITQVYQEDLIISQDKSCEFLTMHNNQGELTFQRLDQLRLQDQMKKGYYKPLTNEDSYLKITAAEILAKCIDAHSGNSPKKLNATLSNKKRKSNASMTSNGNEEDEGDNHSQLIDRKASSKFKLPNYENFMTAQIIYTDIDFELGILVFYNKEGMLAIVNFFTMVRKFLQLGLQGNVNKIRLIEKDNHDNTQYLVKKSSFKNFSLSDFKKLLTKKRMYYDDYTFVADPNYSVIFVCENDIIEIRNDAKANTCGFKNKIAFNEKVVDTFYVKNKLQMFAICRDGTIREIETESFTIKRFFRLYWEDISCSFMNVSGATGETTLICGHDKGIITSELIDSDHKRSNILERKFQIHNFHRKQIVSIHQPANTPNQFVSLCQERIVCIWFIDNERPLKALYFANDFNFILSFSDSIVNSSTKIAGGSLQNLPNIDRIILVGNNRIFETETRSAPYYRSYNEEIQYEWECFSYEISKQIQQMRKSIYDTKQYESEKRFDYNKVNHGSLISLKQEIMRKLQVDTQPKIETLNTDVQDQTQEIDQQVNTSKSNIPLSKDSSMQFQRVDFFATLNSFMSNTSLESLPLRLLDLEYHIIIKRSSLQTLSDLEKLYLSQYLNIDYQYLKVLRSLNRDQILQSAKHQIEKDKATMQLQKIKDQNQRINAEMHRNIDISYKKKEEEQKIMMKTLELKSLNQKRKNNPTLMMGLINMPNITVDSKSKERLIELEQQKLLDLKAKRNIQVKDLLKQQDVNYLQHVLQNQGDQIQSARTTQKGFHKSSSTLNLKSNFHIKLPQITINDYQKELLSIRDSLKSRELNLMSNQQSFYSLKHGPISTRKNSSENLHRKQLSNISANNLLDEQQQQLYIAPETNLIRQPPQTMKRTDHLLNSHRVQGQDISGRLQVRIAALKTERVQSSEKVQRVDNSPPKNFPLRNVNRNLEQHKNIIQNDVRSSNITDQTTTDRLHNSLSKVSHVISMPSSHQLLLNSQFNLENQLETNRSSKNIPKARFFSNQRLQNEILKPLISDQQSPSQHQSQQSQQQHSQHLGIQSILIPKVVKHVSTEANNSSQVKISADYIPLQESQLSQPEQHNQPQLNEQNNNLISNAPPTKVVDARQFWQNYQDKLNHIKNNQHQQMTKVQSARSLPSHKLQQTQNNNKQGGMISNPINELVINSQSARLMQPQISNRFNYRNQNNNQNQQHYHQPLQQQNRGTNPLNNDSQGQMSTEPNSKVINEQSIEEEEKDANISNNNNNLSQNNQIADVDNNSRVQNITQRQPSLEEGQQQVQQPLHTEHSITSQDTDLQVYVLNNTQDQNNKSSTSSRNYLKNKNSSIVVPNDNIQQSQRMRKVSSFSVLPFKVKGVNMLAQNQDDSNLKEANANLDKISLHNYNTNQQSQQSTTSRVTNPMIDNVAYIESFFNFKVDPMDLLQYFDQYDIDVDTLTKDQIKQILLNYLNERQQALRQSHNNTTLQKQLNVLRTREQNKIHKMQMEELHRVKQQQAKQMSVQRDQKVFEEIFKKYSIEQQRFQEFFDEKNNTNQQQTNQLPKKYSSQPLVNQQKQKQLTQEQSRKQLEQFIKGQIIEKWLMRKVYKCIELLDRGMDREGVLSKVCPEGVFDETNHDKTGQLWRHNKIKKGRKDKFKQNDYNSMSDNEQSKQRPGSYNNTNNNSQNINNNDLGMMLKIDTKQQSSFMRTQQLENQTTTNFQKNSKFEDYRFQLGDGTSTLHLRQGGSQDTLSMDEQEEDASQGQNYFSGNTINKSASERTTRFNKQKNQDNIVVTDQEENKTRKSKRKNKNTGNQNIKTSAKTPRNQTKQKSKINSQKDNLQNQKSSTPLVPNNNTNEYLTSDINRRLNELPQSDPLSKIDQPSQIIYENEFENSVFDGASSIAAAKKQFLFQDKKDSMRSMQTIQMFKSYDQDRQLQEQSNEEENGELKRDPNTFAQLNQDTFDSLKSNKLPLDLLQNQNDLPRHLRNQSNLNENYYTEQNLIQNSNDLLAGLSMARKVNNATDSDGRTSNMSSAGLAQRVGRTISREGNNQSRLSQVNDATNGSNLKERLQKSLKKKFQSQAQRSDKSKNMTNLSSNNNNTQEGVKTDQSDSAAAAVPTTTNSINQLMKVLQSATNKIIRKSILQKGSSSNQGRKSTLSQGNSGGDQSNSERQVKSPLSPLQKKMTIKKVGSKRALLIKDNMQAQEQEALNRQNSIQERISEDSSHNIRIDLESVDVGDMKDKLFSMISSQLFELSPTNRIEQIKLAATLEQISFEQLREMGIQFNARRDNYQEIIQKIKEFQKEQEAKNAGVKINKKTFLDLKKRLLPDKNIAAQDFVNLLKQRTTKKDLLNIHKSPQKMSSIDHLNSMMRRAIDEIGETGDDHSYNEDHITVGINNNQEPTKILKCDEILHNMFEKDKDFNFFQGRLKEYRMKFGQQTQFVESVNDVEDQDRRDYATFDRLEAFKKHQDTISGAYQKMKKIETTKGLVRDVPALSGEGNTNNGVQDMGHYYINVEGNGNDKPDEKFSLNSLCDDIYNMFLEVKKKNKKIGLNAVGDKKSNENNRKGTAFTDERESTVGGGPSGTSQQINTNNIDDSINSTNILKKFRSNLDEKKRLEQMTDLERSERKYGLMVKNDADYLNPKLSSKYTERQYFSQTSRGGNEGDPTTMHNCKNKNGMGSSIKLPDISTISKFSYISKQYQNTNHL